MGFYLRVKSVFAVYLTGNKKTPKNGFKRL